MNKRERPLLVLSPRVRHADQACDYRPFGGRSLATILRDVAAGVSQHPLRQFDEHRVSDRFFFGSTRLDDRLIEELQRIPASIIDCEIYRSPDVAAVDAAKNALSHFARGDSKMALLTCPDGCGVITGYASQRVVDEDGLFAYLWLDLCGGAFRRIGDVIARHRGD